MRTNLLKLVWKKVLNDNICWAGHRMAGIASVWVSGFAELAGHKAMACAAREVNVDKRVSRRGSTKMCLWAHTEQKKMYLWA